MHFRKYMIGSVLLCIALVGCTEKNTVTYIAHFNVDSLAQTTYLGQAVERVMVRKLTAMGIEKPRVISAPIDKSNTLITFTLPTKESREIVEKMTKEKITFDLRIQKKPNDDPKNIDPDNWIPTGLTGSSLVWVQALGDRSTGNISIDLEFTEKATNILREVYKNNKGKSLGIFVRDLLVSALLIEEELTSNHVRIGGVPSENIAGVFSDDLNVGLSTTFTLQSR